MQEQQALHLLFVTWPLEGRIKQHFMKANGQSFIVQF